MLRLRILAILFCLSIFSSSLQAQAPGTGLYALGSFDQRGFDTINLGNLNVHFEIPIVNKPGRGQAFTYKLVYDGLLWSPVGSSGNPTWVPDSGWGLHGQLNEGFAGYYNYHQGQVKCFQDPPSWYWAVTTSNYVYHDAFGQQHTFNYATNECFGTTTGTGSSSDGSGYRFDGAFVVDRHGNQLHVPWSSVSGAGSITDTNGNVVNNNGDGTFTDTLAVTALAITGGGTAGSPRALTYKVSNQADGSTTAAMTMYYVTYTVQTNFGCAVGDYGPNQVDLVDHITLPDGTFYQFNYEPTPGFPGTVTGRLSSITLPTGGTIGYQYTGGCNGNGLNTDGTVGSLTRVTSDGSRSYTRSPINANATSTTVQDEKGNQALYQFAIAGGSFYETHRQIYQGAIGGPDLLDRFTCYNGVQPPCDGASITLPIGQTIAYESYNNGLQTNVRNVYDPSGMLTSSAQMQAGSNLEVTTNTYNSLEEVLSSTTTDGSGNVVASSSYGYDETAPTATSGIPQHAAAPGTRGNQTSSHVSTGSGTLSTTTAYYDTGVPVSTTTPNGQTQYSYDSTQTFPTGVTLPTPSSGVQLATSASYDQQSGVQISATGMNSGQTTQYTQYDRLLRPTLLTLPNSSVVTLTYNSNDTEVNQNRGSGANADNHTLVDAYGRTSRIAVYNGQAAGIVWYQVDYCYDATGLLQFQSTPYQGSGFSGANATKQCSGSGTTYSYDGLGRVTNINNADGNKQYSYNSRAVRVTDVNGVQRITQYDLLGRISAVCEISSNSSMPASGSPASCGMDIAGTGFLTTYVYDLANHKTTVTQGAQTRIFQTDSLGRTIFTQEPESGQTSYSYAYVGPGLQVKRTRPRANQPDPNVKTNTTTQFDSMGRIVSVTYDDGTPSKNFIYDSNANWTNFAQTNLKGRLSDAYVLVAGNWAGTALSYDSIGRIIGMAECLPSGCGNPASDKHLSFAYDWTGNMTSASDGAGVTTSYSYTPASEVQLITSSLSNATHPGTLVSNVQNGPNGPLSYQSGNGAMSSFSYDTLGRRNGGWVCNNSTQNGCIGGSQLYGYVANSSGSRVTSSADTALNQQSTYGYDEFNRLTSLTVTSGTVQNYTYAYDRYGNRWQQNALQGGPSPQFSFDSGSNRISGYSYDAAGNITADGINTYQYDAEGNLIQETSGSTFQYTYNALNQQIRADYGSEAAEIVFNASGQIASVWLAGSSTPLIGKAYWGSTPLESYQTGANMAYFQHGDWLGSLRLETDGTGAVSVIRTNLPFGDDAVNASGHRDNSYDGFAGLWDGMTSASNHAQYREYSNLSGRWMSPDPYSGSYDPSNPQSLNRYSYVLNNPLVYVDPSGQNFINDLLDFFGGFGFGVGDDGGGGSSFPFWDWTSPGTQSPAVGGSGGGGDGGGDGGSNSNTPQPKPAPNNGKKPTTRQCADQIANTWSLTGVIPDSVMNVPVLGGFLNGALGNTVTNVTSVYDSVVNGQGTLSSTYGVFLGAGPTLGVPVPGNAPAGLQGPVAVATGAIATGAGKLVGASKAILDGLIYLEAVNYCKTGKY